MPAQKSGNRSAIEGMALKGDAAFIQCAILRRHLIQHVPVSDLCDSISSPSRLLRKQGDDRILAYPCTLDTWTSPKERGMVSHKAAVCAGKRDIDLAMVAIPLGEKVDEIVD